MLRNHRTDVDVRRDDFRRGDIVRIDESDYAYEVTRVVRPTTGSVAGDPSMRPFAHVRPAPDRDDAGPGKREPALVRLRMIETACTCHLKGALSGLHDNAYGADPTLPVCRVPSAPEAIASRLRMSAGMDEKFETTMREAGVPEYGIAELRALSEKFGAELRADYAQRTLREYGVI